MKKIKVVLDWFANTNHTGFYVALKNGLYTKANLDVEISGAVHGAMNVKDAHIVLAPQPSILTKIDEGSLLTAVAVLTQKNDSGIISLKQNNITSPKMLENKKLTHWKPKWFHSVIKKAVEIDGGHYSKVDLVLKDVGDIKETLLSDAQAVWIYKSWEYFVMTEQNIDVNYFALSDIHPVFDFCAPCMCATTEFINCRDELYKFMKATQEGYAYAANYPEKSAKLLMEYMHIKDERLITQSQKYISSLYLNSENNWGVISPKRWETFADFMVEEGLIKTRTPYEYTNEYLR